MKVTLTKTWFAPGFHKKLDKIRSISGKRYRKGTHDMPDEYREFLPTKGVTIHDDDYVPPAPEPEAPFNPSSVDLGQATSDQINAAHEQAQKTTDRDRALREKNAAKMTADLAAEAAEAEATEAEASPDLKRGGSRKPKGK